MKTKFILVSCLFLFISFKTTVAQVQWNVKLGINSSNILIDKSTGRDEDAASRIGFTMGLGADIGIWRDLSIQPTFQYARRGFTIKEPYAVGWGSNFQATTSYLELPVDIVYSPKLGSGNLLIGAGPYIAYGTGGKWKTDNTVLIGDIMIGNEGDLVFQNDASYGEYGTYTHARPWDYGLHGKIGYQFLKKYSIQLEYQQSIKNLEPRWGDYDTENRIRNSAWGLSIGYQF